MKQKNFFVKATLAVALAIFSSTAAMGQDTVKADSAKTSVLEKKWVKDLASRIQLHGYAQGGYNYTHQGETCSLLGKCPNHRPLVVPIHARLLECRTGILHRLSYH